MGQIQKNEYGGLFSVCSVFVPITVEPMDKENMRNMYVLRIQIVPNCRVVAIDKVDLWQFLPPFVILCYGESGSHWKKTLYKMPSPI